jgi:hypothetical protein
MINKNIKPYNNNYNNLRHGYWELYSYLNTLYYKCTYHNGKISGYGEYYPFKINSTPKLEKRFHII